MEKEKLDKKNQDKVVYNISSDDYDHNENEEQIDSSDRFRNINEEQTLRYKEKDQFSPFNDEALSYSPFIPSPNTPL